MNIIEAAKQKEREVANQLNHAHGSLLNNPSKANKTRYRNLYQQHLDCVISLWRLCAVQTEVNNRLGVFVKP